MNIKAARYTALAVLALLIGAFSASAELTKAEREFLERRIAVCYFEGMDLGELVVGARGCLTFLYVDERMGSALQSRGAPSDGSLPNAMAQHLLRYSGGYARRKGYIMFVVAVEAFKNWELDTADLHVGGYAPADGDFVTGALGDPRYEVSPGKNLLPPKYSGLFSFYAPASAFAPGSTVELGLGDHSVSWQVPAKNK